MSKDLTWAIATADWDNQLNKIISDVEKGHQKNIEKHKKWILERIPQYEVLLEKLIKSLLRDRGKDSWIVVFFENEPSSRIPKNMQQVTTEILYEKPAKEVDFAICSMIRVLWYFHTPMFVGILDNLKGEYSDLWIEIRKMENGVNADNLVSLNEATKGIIWIRKEIEKLIEFNEKIETEYSTYEKEWLKFNDFDYRRLKYTRGLAENLRGGFINEKSDLFPEYQTLRKNTADLIKVAEAWKSRFESVLDGHT